MQEEKFTMKRNIGLCSFMFSAIVVFGTLGDAYAAARIELPTNQITITVTTNNLPNAYFLVTLSSVQAGFDVTNGNYLAWCINPYLGIKRKSYGSWLYSSIDGSVPPDFASANWHCINYIINQKAYY